MFSKKDYENIKNRLLDYRNKIKMLDELKKDVSSSILRTQDNCNHDLVLCYGNDGELKIARCLICDSYMNLCEDMDIFSEKIISKKSIIDVTDRISEDGQRRLRGSENILFLTAKEKLNEIINSYNKGNEIPIEYIKIKIVNELISYDKECEQKRLIKRDDKK